MDIILEITLCYKLTHLQHGCLSLISNPELGKVCFMVTELLTNIFIKDVQKT